MLDVARVFLLTSLGKYILTIFKFYFQILARQKKKERNGQIIEVFDGHEDGINCLAIAPDESVLVSGSEDSTVRIWDLEDLEPITPLPNEDEISSSSMAGSRKSSMAGK